jgi:DNA primase
MIQQIEERLDMVAFVQTYLPLTLRGKNWMGCCPFHGEKTASFSVDPIGKRYHCFGCKAGGGFLQFYMAMEGGTFAEAVVGLATRLGIEVATMREEDQLESKQRKALIDLYQKITASFEYLLWNSARGEDALAYLHKRKVSEESIKKFRLGYGMTGAQELYRFLTKRGYSEAFLAQSGLFSSKSREYSLFRDRILFPLIDAAGQVIAYSGRAMPDADAGAPKYINSPETSIFSKRRELFGVWQAKDTLRKGEFILCEGAMDVLALHQMGYPQAVAPLGSAITAEQIALVTKSNSHGSVIVRKK